MDIESCGRATTWIRLTELYVGGKLSFVGFSPPIVNDKLGILVQYRIMALAQWFILFDQSLQIQLSRRVTDKAFCLCYYLASLNRVSVMEEKVKVLLG